MPMRKSVAPWGTSNTRCGAPHVPGDAQAGEAGGLSAELMLMPQSGRERIVARTATGHPV